MICSLADEIFSHVMVHCAVGGGQGLEHIVTLAMGSYNVLCVRGARFMRKMYL